MDQSERARIRAAEIIGVSNRGLAPHLSPCRTLQAECPKHAQFRAIPKTQGALRFGGKISGDAG